MPQVVVSGGGPVGLAAAIELGRRGVSCVVVEPRTQVSHARPRCKTVNVRTMEHLRRWGIAEQLREWAPLSPSYSTDVVFCTSLTGHELSRFTGVLGLAVPDERSPEIGQQAPQYVLEELLRAEASALPGVSLRLGRRVLDLAQDEDGVTVRCDDGSVLTADYVLGCDGPRSAVRAAIGSSYVGDVALRPNLGMVFRAPGLADRVHHGPAVQYWTVNPASPALLGPLEPDDGTWWIIAFGAEPGADGAALIDAAVGEPVGAEVLSTDPWTARMQLVDTLRVGRVFLAGDAAHLNPPFGGHGLNTGIGDAVDLGWKLAAVLDGWGGPVLLDSYAAERRPVQDRVIAAASANMRTLSTDLVADDLDASTPAGDTARAAAHRRIQESKHDEFHALDLVLDVDLAGSPVVAPGAGERLAPARLHDLLGPGYTLLTPPGADATALTGAAQRRGVPMRVVTDGTEYVLVRTDQHVAWRGPSLPDDPIALLDRVTGTVTVPGPVPAADRARSAVTG